MGSEAQSVLLAERGESRDARRVVEGGSPSTTAHSVSIRQSCGALFGEAPRTTESFGSLLTAKAPWCRGRWAYRPTRWLLDEASADSRPAGRPDGRCVCWGFGLMPKRGSRADLRQAHKATVDDESLRAFVGRALRSEGLLSRLLTGRHAARYDLNRTRSSDSERLVNDASTPTTWVLRNSGGVLSFG